MTLQIFLAGLYAIANVFVIPAIISLCVIAFLVNVIRYFILNSGYEDGRENARRYMIWSLVGFVMILALWGLINLILVTLGTPGGVGPLCPDYDPTC